MSLDAAAFTEQLFEVTPFVLPGSARDHSDDDIDTGEEPQAAVAAAPSTTPFRLPQQGEARGRHLAWKAGVLRDWQHMSGHDIEQALLEENQRFTVPLEPLFVQGVAATVAFTRPAPSQRPLTHPTSQALTSGVLTFAEVNKLIAAQGEKPDVVSGMFAAESINLVAGDSALGKTPYFFQMGIAIAAGIPFLGYTTTQGKVIYIDFENGLKRSEKLAAALARNMSLPGIPDGFRIWPLGYSGECNLEAIVAKERPALVIIDPLGTYCPEAIEKPKAAAEFATFLRTLAHKYSVAFILIHHLRKPPAGFKLPTLEDSSVVDWLQQASGPRALVNYSDCRMGIAAPSRAMHAGEGREIALAVKFFTRLEGETGPLYVARTYDDEGSPRCYSPLITIELLDNADQQDCFRELPAEFTTGQAQRAYGREAPATMLFLNKCVRLGLLEKAGRGHWKKTPEDKVEMLSH